MPHAPIWIEDASNSDTHKRKKQSRKQRDFGNIHHVPNPSLTL